MGILQQVWCKNWLSVFQTNYRVVSTLPGMEHLMAIVLLVGRSRSKDRTMLRGQDSTTECTRDRNIDSMKEKPKELKI